MKYSIVLHPVKMQEWGLNLTEATIFSFCYELPSWATAVVVDGITMFRGNRRKASEEMGLGLAPDTVYRTYKKLHEKGLIVYVKNGNDDLIALTAVGRTWGWDGKKSEDSEKNPSKLGKKSESHYIVYKDTSNKPNSPATAEQPPPATQEKEKCTDVPPPPGFDEIWNLYGHKQQKADAIKAYKAMKSQADKDALTEAVPAYLTFLSLPDNSWRQKKLLGAFIRGRMWEDDFAAKKVEQPTDMSAGNGSLYDFVSKEFPNVQKMKWLTNEQFEIFDTRGTEMFGGNYTIYASPIALKKHIRDSFSELNSNSFKRSQYQDVYSYLCEDLKKRIYPK